MNVGKVILPPPTNGVVGQTHGCLVLQEICIKFVYRSSIADSVAQLIHAKTPLLTPTITWLRRKIVHFQNA